MINSDAIPVQNHLNTYSFLMNGGISIYFALFEGRNDVFLEMKSININYKKCWSCNKREELSRCYANHGCNGFLSTWTYHLPKQMKKQFTRIHQYAPIIFFSGCSMNAFLLIILVTTVKCRHFLSVNPQFRTIRHGKKYITNLFQRTIIIVHQNFIIYHWTPWEPRLVVYSKSNLWARLQTSIYRTWRSISPWLQRIQHSQKYGFDIILRITIWLGFQCKEVMVPSSWRLLFQKESAKEELKWQFLSDLNKEIFYLTELSSCWITEMRWML